MCVIVSYSVCTSASVAALLEAHAHPPRVVGENFLLLLHNAGVRALVDGVGHDGDVVVLEGDVVWVGVLQQLAVLVPAGRKKSTEKQILRKFGI